MGNTRFDTRASQWIGDLPLWQQHQQPDNSEQLERLKRNLRLARRRELTPRQQQILAMYFEGGMTMPQIARALGVHTSTVSRTLKRARSRLERCLRYGL